MPMVAMSAHSLPKPIPLGLGPRCTGVPRPLAWRIEPLSARPPRGARVSGVVQCTSLLGVWCRVLRGLDARISGAVGGDGGLRRRRGRADRRRSRCGQYTYDALDDRASSSRRSGGGRGDALAPGEEVEMVAATREQIAKLSEGSAHRPRIGRRAGLRAAKPVHLGGHHAVAAYTRTPRPLRPCAAALDRAVRRSRTAESQGPHR